jgi:hypothetical protein
MFQFHDKTRLGQAVEGNLLQNKPPARLAVCREIPYAVNPMANGTGKGGGASDETLEELRRRLEELEAEFEALRRQVEKIVREGKRKPS